MKVLVVDDSKTIRNIQKRILEQLGYTEVHEAEDGQIALQVVQEVSPDLILVDWNMPNMDGITLVKTIRQTDKTIPLIMCTTEAEKSRVVEALRAGVNNYVVKPFTAETLSDKINQTLSKLGIAAS